MNVQVLRSRTSIDAAMQQWHATFGDSLFDLSVSPEWSLLAAESAGLRDAVRFATLCDSHGNMKGASVYVETMERTYGVTVRARELPGNRLMAYHHDLVAENRAELIRGIAEDGDARCDVLLIPAVERGSPTDDAAITFATRCGAALIRVPGVRSPYIPISGSWESYLATRSANFRQNLKRKLRALNAHGEVTERWFETEDQVDELFRHMTRVESESWKVAAGMSITGNQQEMQYYFALVPWLARRRALSANVLFVAHEPVAYSLCYRWRNRLSQMKTSFDERLGPATPGLTANATAIRNAFATGAVEFDFLGDVMPHKMHWTDKFRVHDNLYLYLPTIRGRFLGIAKSLVSRIRPRGILRTVGRGGHRASG